MIPVRRTDNPNAAVDDGPWIYPGEPGWDEALYEEYLVFHKDVIKIMKPKIKYMHTIDGRPGSYYPGTQICFAVRTRPIRLAESLAQIRREQRATRKWRANKGFKDIGSYDHLRVLV